MKSYGKEYVGRLARRSLSLLIGGNSAREQDVAPPGTPVFVGEETNESVRIAVTDYSESEFDEQEVDTVEELFRFRERNTVSWINVTGVHDVEAIMKIGDQFGLHPLIQEDIANTSQRPKMEDYNSHLFLVIRMLRSDAAAEQIIPEQISLVLGPGYVITFQEGEREMDVFEPIRTRIRKANGRIRTMGSDYLFYCLLDAVVDGYFTVLEQTGERVERLEEAVVRDAVPATLADIHDLRTQIAFLRKSVWPLREAVSGLERTESELVSRETKVFLRDVYDHTVQLFETIETVRDVASSLFEMYLSMVSNRTNEVMKVLTMIATIFIPLTFVAGIYGMNFEHMPELSVPWAYPAVWGVMFGIVAFMLVYFKRKDWL